MPRQRWSYEVVAGAGSGGVLPQGDDDVVAEGLELAAGVAGFAAAVGVLRVPVGSEGCSAAGTPAGMMRCCW